MRRIQSDYSYRGLQEALFYLIFLVIPFDRLAPVQISQFKITPSTIIVLLLAFTILVDLCERGFRIRFPKSVLFPISMLAILFVVDFLAIFRSERGVYEALESLSAILIFLMTIILAHRNAKVIRRALQVLASLLAVGGILAVIQSLGYPFWSEVIKSIRIGGAELPFGRTTGFPMDYGLYGILNFSVLPLALISVLNRKGLYSSRSVALIVSLLILLAIFISQSRSTWLALTLVLAILLICSPYKVRSRKHMFVGLVGVGLILLGIFCTNTIRDRVVDIYESNPFAVQERFHQYDAAIQIIRSHPIAGIGYGQFSKVYESLPTPWEPRSGVWMLHSYFLNRAVATGLISALLAVILFVWVAIMFWRAASKRLKGGEEWFAIGLLSAFTGIMVELAFYPGSSGLKIVWAYFGFAVICARGAIMAPKRSVR